MELKQTMNGNDVVVYLEREKEVLLPVSEELLSEGRRLADTTGGLLRAVIVGNTAHTDIPALYGTDIVHHIPYRGVCSDVALCASTVANLLHRLQADIFLVGATEFGRVFAPMVAAYLQTGITADCTQFAIDKEGNLVQIRPALGGNIMAHIISPDHRPQCATVRPGTFSATPYRTERYPKIIVEQEVVMDSDRIVRTSTEQVSNEEEHAIDRHPLLVAIGAGIKTKGEVERLQQFARALGAELAASRELVEQGLMPRYRQVGQSGKTVAPKWYIAIGISGAVQHIAGMRDAEFVLAVNSDKDAPIHQEADISIVARWQDVLDELQEIILEKIKK